MVRNRYADGLMTGLHKLLPCVLLAALAGTVLPAHAQPAAASARPAITGIAFIRVYEDDPKAAARFYGKELGYTPVTLPDGDTVYPVNAHQWVETIPHTGPDASDRLAAVGFTTSNAAKLQTYLAAKGFPAVEPLKSGQFAVRDPEGNLVAFVQAGSDRAVAASSPSARASSHRMIHVGFLVEDRAKEDAFWRDALGFKPYWHGTGKDGTVGDDYVSQQVPNGTDWLEYMMHVPKSSNLYMHGMMNHFSLGVANMQTVVAGLKANGCTDSDCSKTQIGRDGKVQLNVFDPDKTRVEYMEFSPKEKPCCSDFTAPHPAATEPK